MYVVATVSVILCVNQNVHLKFMNPNGRQFVQYVTVPIDTAGVTYGTGLETKSEFWVWGSCHLCIGPTTLCIATCTSKVIQQRKLSEPLDGVQCTF